MVNSKMENRSSAADNVQSVPVPGVPGSEESTIPVASSDRVFNFRPFLAHYRHLKAGESNSFKCAFCAGGPEAVSVVVTQKLPDRGVDGGAGVDEKEDPALSSRRDVPWDFGYEGPGT